jgi:hypothetical protein
MWTMTVPGGTPPLSYQFWVNRGGVGWVLARDYQTTNTFTYLPPGAEHYGVIGFVRQAGSTAGFDAWTSREFDIVDGGGPARLISLTADLPFPAPAGSIVAWTARGTGGLSGPLQYRFVLYSQRTNTWTVARDWSTSPLFSWTTGSDGPGLYILQVWVRSAATTGAYDDWASSGYIILR